MRFLLFILLLFYYEVQAQSVFSGKTRTKEGKELENVNITLLLPQGKTVLAFSSSAKDGSYSMKFNRDNDSVRIVVASMGYETQSVLVANRSQTLNFSLVQGETQLKEVIIKPPPVRKLGDTLTYITDKFRAETDRTLTDVMRKLPGIEVDRNGEIKYMGKSINSFYIEGLDLMKGRYGIINENLSIDQVQAVEVMENHQQIRALDGIKISETAALNIRLKKKLVASHALYFGLGAKPMLWDANLTSMFFSPKLQSAVSYQGNNTGSNIRRQLTDHTSRNSGVNGVHSASDWLGVAKAALPPTNTERWLDNRSHLGSINLLRALKNGTQITLNSGLTLDDITQNSQSHKTYTIENSVIEYREHVNNLFKHNVFNSSLTLEKNNRTTYFTNKLTFEKDWGSDFGNSQRTNINYSQNLNGQNHSLSNRFATVLNKGKDIYNLSSYTSFKSKNHTLTVDVTGIDTLASPMQNLGQRSFYTNNSLQFTRVIGKLKLFATAGSIISVTELESTLTDYPLVPTSQNDFTWKHFDTYVQLEASYALKKWFFRLEAPLHLHNISYNEKANFNKLNVEPKLFVRNNLSPNLSLLLNSNYSNPLSRFGDMYGEYIMQSYLSLSRSNQVFRNDHVLNNMVGLNYRNTANVTMAHLNYTHTLGYSGILGSNNIGGDGLNTSEYLQHKNTSTSHAIAGRMSRFFFDIYLTPAIGFAYITNTQLNAVNGEINKYRNSSISPFLSATFSGVKAVDTEYKLSYNNYRFRSNSNYLLSHELKASIRLRKSVFLKMLVEHVKNDLGHRPLSTVFADLKLQIRIPKIKQDIDFGFYNIFDQEKYRNITTTDFAYMESIYQLRPRQFIIRGKVNI